MGNTLSKRYLELFAEARKEYDFNAMETLFQELCGELNIQDPQTQAETQVREKAVEQAGIDAGKALAELRNLRSKQNSDANGMIGKKV